jgi:hypothetical protein
MYHEKDKIIQIIKDGGFTCLVKSYPFRHAKQFSNEIWIRILFYKCLSVSPSQPILVYRGLRSVQPKAVYHCPLPFSTSKSFHFVQHWIQEDYRLNQTHGEVIQKLILYIFIHPTIPILNLNDNPKESDEEQEITLAPGKLVVIDQNQSSNYTFFFCIYKPYESTQVLATLRELLSD